MTNLVDLSPAHLAIVEQILAEYVPECEVRAFGSRATWNSRDTSDLDLAVIGDGPLPSRTLTMLKEAFEESRLPMCVDVIDWHAIADSFREFIEPDCVVVQETVGSGPWPVIRLGEVVHVNPPRPLKRGTNAPFVAMGDLIEHSRLLPSLTTREFKGSGSRFRNGDTLLARITPSLENGKTAWVSGLPKGVVGHGSTEFIVMSARDNLMDSKFVYYLARSPEFRRYAIGQMTGTSGRQRVPSDVVRDFEFAFPPIEEQRTIARVLGALDDMIELNQRICETLEEMTWAIFKSWFVDFNPVRAKMKGRSTGLPQDLSDLFPDRLVDSEMGKIPEGWVHESIYRFANVIYGAPFASNQFNTENEGVPLIRIRDLSTHNPRVSTRQIHKKGHLINPGDIIVGMDGAFQLEVWKGPTSWLNQRVCHFEPRPRIPTSFLVGALQEPLAFFERGKAGTTVIHLGKADLDTIRLLQPSQEILDTFAETGELLLEKAIAKSRESRTLTVLRDTLLPKLISGAICVSDAEKIMEVVA